jgi:F-type H+-transporting ATPase subunit delta
MASSRNTVGASAPFAHALLDLANRQGKAQEIAQELADVKDVLKHNPTFNLFLRDPSVSRPERRRVIDSTLAGKINPLLLNTIRVLNNRGRLSLLSDLADTYRQLLDRQLGNVHVDVTVAAPLDPQTLEDVRTRVSAALGKNAVVKQHVDESIIGGLVLRVEDKRIDASVKSQLESMKQRLMQAASQQKTLIQAI